MSASFLDAALQTPQARQGPSSRLLQRRSLLVRQDQEAALMATPSANTPAAAATAVSAINQVPDASLLAVATPTLATSFRGREFEVTRPVYAYQPLEDVTGNGNHKSQQVGA